MALSLCMFVSPSHATDLRLSVGDASGAASSNGPLVAFWVFGVLALVGAVATISRRSLVSASLWLVFTLICTAGLYLVLHATFLAAMQVLVYAGAVMVLFLFVVMIVGPEERTRIRFPRDALPKVLGIVALGVIVERLIRAAVIARTTQPDLVADNFGTVRSVGKLLFQDYLFAFEAVSVLLLVAIVAAVMVTRSATEIETRKAEDS